MCFRPQSGHVKKHEEESWLSQPPSAVPECVSGARSVRRELEMKSITSIPAVAGIAVAACLASSAVAGPVAGQTINLEFKVSRPALPVHINYVFGERASSMNRSGGSFGYAGFVNCF